MALVKQVYKPKFLSSCKLILFGNKNNGQFSIHYRPDNILEQSKARLVRKIRNNDVYVKYWFTLTFAEKVGVYDIDNLTFEASHSLNEINEKNTFTSVAREFFNRIKVHIKKKYSIDCAYWYCYEQGSKRNRPHFHGCINLPVKTEIAAREYLIKKWKFGNVDVETVGGDKNKIMNYLNCYLNKEKTYKHDKFVGKRFWNTSRHYKPVKPNPDFQLIGVSNCYAGIKFLIKISKLSAMEFSASSLDIMYAAKEIFHIPPRTLKPYVNQPELWWLNSDLVKSDGSVIPIFLWIKIEIGLDYG